MIYKLIVNAAFLAIGYYIGKEVSRAEFARDHVDRSWDFGRGHEGRGTRGL